jgi:serine/threonine protein kinase/tetratricopeptide (TPR) repeat protein
MSDEKQTGLTSIDGRYSLIRRVGRGGMGEVWEAEDRLVDRRVALKFARAGREGWDADRWLAAEAQTIVRLSHPALVPLLDRCQMGPSDGDAGRSALVFEFIAGRPLGLWADRPRPWSWIRGLVEQILEALAYAHGRGVVHRDLKPANILLSGEPTQPDVHLLDFGIAALYSPGRSRDSYRSSIALVPSQMAPGTRSYMAPEQLEGELGDLGPWSDLYSLGVLVAELLLGRLPFDGADDDAVWEGRLASRFTPPTVALADLGVPLRRWLLRLLAPDPALRFGWAADAARALPPLGVKDATAAHHDPLSVPEATETLMEVAKRAEDRDTDPDQVRKSGVGQLGSINRGLELGPAVPRDVRLPPSWDLDQPDLSAWAEGLLKVPAEDQLLVPAGSYGLLAMRDAPLRGRDSLWADAWRHLRRVSDDRRPVLLLIEGPSGRGKTRFARELASVAEEVGVARSHHVRFRADGSGAGALRRLLLQVLRIARLPEGEREGRIQRVLAEAGYPSGADLAPRLVGMITTGAAGRGASREEASTALELFGVLGRRRPLLLWLEDVDRGQDQVLTHWLSALLSSDVDLPVAVVATRRQGAQEDTGFVDSDWALLQAHPRSLCLQMEPLDPEAISDILRVTAGSSKELGAEIARWSEGDPRAASQTARHLHESEQLRWTPEGFVLGRASEEGAVSLRLEPILAARAKDAVQKSPDPGAAAIVLDLLALVRERAVHEHLMSAAERLGFDEQRVEEALAPLVVGELVDAREEGSRLAHAVLREHLASRMDLTRKAAVHRAWANVLEASGRGYGRAERLLEAAWNRAGCGEEEQAARAELEAAHLLRARWELKAAWRAVQRADQRCSSGRTELRPEEMADLQVLSALLEHAVREPCGTPSDLAMSLDMLQHTWSTLGPCVERCRAHLAHAEALGAAGRPEEVREALQRGLDSARAAESWSWECSALVGLARDRRMAGRLAEAELLIEQAGAVAQRLGDEGLLHEVLVVRLAVALARRDLVEAQQRLDALRIALRNRASWQDLQALWQFRGEVEWLAGRRGPARQALETARGLGRDRGLPIVSALLGLAAMALEDGEEKAAGEVLSESAALSEVGDPHSHEQRVSRAILGVEHGLRYGDQDAGIAALQDAEILMRQFLIADPRGLESLERSAAAEGLDSGLVIRIKSLSQTISAALEPTGGAS